MKHCIIDAVEEIKQKAKETRNELRKTAIMDDTHSREYFLGYAHALEWVLRDDND